MNLKKVLFGFGLAAMLVGQTLHAQQNASDETMRKLLVGTWRAIVRDGTKAERVMLEFSADGKAHYSTQDDHFFHGSVMLVVGTIYYKWYLKNSVLIMDFERCDGPVNQVMPWTNWASKGNQDEFEFVELNKDKLRFHKKSTTSGNSDIEDKTYERLR